MSGYRVSGSADLFPQNWIEPTFTSVTQVKELSEELQQTLATMRHKKLTLATLKMLKEHVNAYIANTPPPQPPQPLEQRVQQRVIDVTPQSLPPILQRVSRPPVTPLANNPIAPGKLQTTKCTHKRNTQANNKPGSLPRITRVNISEPTPTVQSAQQSAEKQLCVNSARKVHHNTTTSTKTQHCLTRLAMPRLHNSLMISHHAVNNLILDEHRHDLPHFTPLKLCPAASTRLTLNIMQCPWFTQSPEQL
jgi:hypothetical protein